MKKTFLIPEPNQPKFEVKMSRLVKLSHKLGSGAVICKKIGTQLVKCNKDMILHFEYEVSGEAPTFNGYQLVAILEREGSSNLVYHVNTEIALPRGMEKREPYCEHCYSNRRRKHLFILRNEKTGDLIQVGKSCVKDFTGGHQNPEWIANWYSFMEEVEEAQRASFEFSFIVPYYNCLTAIAHSAYHTEQNGFVKKDDGTPYNPSTAKLTEESLRDESWKIDLKELGYHEKAQAVIDWILSKENVEYGYFSNLKTIVSNSNVRASNLGIIASAYSVYLREQQKRAMGEVERKTKGQSEYVGEIGDKAIYELTFDKEISFETDFGWMSIYYFHDQDDNVFIWKTATNLEADEGETLKIKGTMKDQNIYNNTKQNVLTRCKVVN